MFALWQKDSVPIQELAKKTQLGKSTLNQYARSTRTYGVRPTQAIFDRPAQGVDRNVLTRIALWKNSTYRSLKN